MDYHLLGMYIVIWKDHTTKQKMRLADQGKEEEQRANPPTPVQL